jgi:hypothetical protein
MKRIEKPDGIQCDGTLYAIYVNFNTLKVRHFHILKFENQFGLNADLIYGSSSTTGITRENTNKIIFEGRSRVYTFKKNGKFPKCHEVFELDAVEHAMRYI